MVVNLRANPSFPRDLLRPLKNRYLHYSSLTVAKLLLWYKMEQNDLLNQCWCSTTRKSGHKTQPGVMVPTIQPPRTRSRPAWTTQGGPSLQLHEDGLGPQERCTRHAGLTRAAALHSHGTFEIRSHPVLRAGPKTHQNPPASAFCVGM